MTTRDPPFCPRTAYEPCPTPGACERRRLCDRLDVAPIDFIMEGVRPAVHFVGFRDPQRYENAVRVFGEPDVIHRVWDQRAQCEVAHGWDTVVFAKYHDTPPSPYSYDDSNEADDPAAQERWA